MIRICQFGAGRIGAIHAANVHTHPGAELRCVVDLNVEAARALAERHGADALESPDEALARGDIDAVIIASSTNTHVELTMKSARAGKGIFCEKPIDLDMDRVEECLGVLEETGAKFFIGFNRRFDPSFAELKRELDAGTVGKLETVIITSRDPGPPPAEYLKVSGGLFRDMMIHDLDLARWLLAEEPRELYAQASCLVDPAIGELGDVDTAMVTLKTDSGVLCQISNSRRAVYGYDQRVEVLGEGGMLQAGNHAPTTVSRWTDRGVSADKPLHFFLERYGDAYRAELGRFIAFLQGDGRGPDQHDGRAALRLANAAVESLEKQAPVRL